jgi:hypothetical protein
MRLASQTGKSEDDVPHINEATVRLVLRCGPITSESGRLDFNLKSAAIVFGRFRKHRGKVEMFQRLFLALSNDT